MARRLEKTCSVCAPISPPISSFSPGRSATPQRRGGEALAGGAQRPAPPGFRREPLAECPPQRAACRRNGFVRAAWANLERQLEPRRTRQFADEVIEHRQACRNLGAPF